MKNQVQHHDFSVDDRWSKTKSAVEKLSDRISKTKNQTERKSLQVQKLSLETELRRLEWQLKESDMTQMYNAARGNLRRLDDLAEGSDAKVGQSESEKKNRDFLLKVVKNIEKTIKDEPPASKKETLIPIMNDLKAHYNILKKRKHDDAMLSDYFVTWATLSSFVRGSPLDKKLLEFASSGFRSKLDKLHHSITSLPESTLELSSAKYREHDLETRFDE